MDNHDFADCLTCPEASNTDLKETLVKFRRSFWNVASAALALCAAVHGELRACTGITLTASDGAVVFGRTLEWGSFDLKSRLVIVPRGHEFKTHLVNSQTGLSWKSVYGAVGVDALEKDFLVDGMNEKGLLVNVFYHPGFAEYAKLNPAKAGMSINSLDVCQYLLTTCATVAEVKKALAAIQVVGVLEPALGIAAPVHLIVTEPSGKAIVIEFTKGETVVHEAPLGVITNAPNYDWHVTNLRNYLNLSPVGLPDRKVEDLDFKPLGGGSGMIGLPGDFTPPSRFIRAVAFAQTARPTNSGEKAVYEVFRILDNFNVPLGAAEGQGEAKTKGMRSATLWTSAYDSRNRKAYYHTMHNRRVRQIDLDSIDFTRSKELVRLPLDTKPAQDIEILTQP
jgi:choloylglycine hydrolase